MLSGVCIQDKGLEVEWVIVGTTSRKRRYRTDLSSYLGWGKTLEEPATLECNIKSVITLLTS